MGKTLLQAHQQAVNALRDKLLKIDGARFPNKFARAAAQLRRLEKNSQPKTEDEPKSTPSQVEYQIEQLLKQLAVTPNDPLKPSSVWTPERELLASQIATLAGDARLESLGGDGGETLLDKIVVAIEAADLKQRKAEYEATKRKVTA